MSVSGVPPLAAALDHDSEPAACVGKPTTTQRTAHLISSELPAFLNHLPKKPFATGRSRTVYPMQSRDGAMMAVAINSKDIPCTDQQILALKTHKAGLEKAGNTRLYLFPEQYTIDEKLIEVFPFKGGQGTEDYKGAKDAYAMFIETRMSKTHPYKEGYKNAITLISRLLEPLKHAYKDAHEIGFYAFMHGDIKLDQFVVGSDETGTILYLTDMPNQASPTDRTIGVCDPIVYEEEGRFHVDDLFGLQIIFCDLLRHFLVEPAFKDEKQNPFDLDPDRVDNKLLMPAIPKKRSRQQLKNYHKKGYPTVTSKSGISFVYPDMVHPKPRRRQGVRKPLQKHIDCIGNPDYQKVTACLVDCLNIIAPYIDEARDQRSSSQIAQQTVINALEHLQNHMSTKYLSRAASVVANPRKRKLP